MNTRTAEAAGNARTTSARKGGKEAIMATTTNPIFFSAAEREGYESGLAVLAGTLTVEKAGDRWLRAANRSHTAGVNWERGYDASGATH